MYRGMWVKRLMVHSCALIYIRENETPLMWCLISSIYIRLIILAVFPQHRSLVSLCALLSSLLWPISFLSSVVLHIFTSSIFSSLSHDLYLTLFLLFFIFSTFIVTLPWLPLSFLLLLQWRLCVLTMSLVSAAASCLKKTPRLAPLAAWVHLPAVPRSSCRPAPSPAPPPTRPPPPLHHPLLPHPPLPLPPRLLSPGPAVWIFPAPCRCLTSASSRLFSGLAASAAERLHLNVTWREVRNRDTDDLFSPCWKSLLSVFSYNIWQRSLVTLGTMFKERVMIHFLWFII